MYVRSIEVDNFRCFRHARMELQFPSRQESPTSPLTNATLILGNNGLGKSSILRAIAIAAVAPVLSEFGFVPYRLVRRPGAKRARLRLKVSFDREEVHLKPHKRRRIESQLAAEIHRRSLGSVDRITPLGPWPSHSKLFYDDRSPFVFVVGYGATRRVETEEYSEASFRKLRGRRYQRIASLFEDHVALRPLQAWLPKQRHRQKEVLALFRKVLPPNIRFSGKFDRREQQYLFEFEGRLTPFASLSDGYKSFIGWIGDMLGHLCEITPRRQAIASATGVVLVDEVDLHLHPEWQRTVVPQVCSAFPSLQFVFTTHSPIVTGTLFKENIYVTEGAARGAVTVRQLGERTRGKSAEQILLSSYFDLETTRVEEFQDEGRKLFSRAAKGDPKAALLYLKRLTEGLRDVPSETVQKRRKAPRKPAKH